MSFERTFGFQSISPKEKSRKVETLFSDVSDKYDLMNDLMSLGVHRKWKDYFVSLLGPSPKKHYLDLAGGTGDIAFKIADACGSGKAVTLLDLTLGMLKKGQERAHRFNHEIQRICASAEAIPFADQSFDGCTISYGLRNCTYIDTVLSEAYRILKSGGKFMCLEFSMPPEGNFKAIYDFYSFNILPKIGKYISNEEEAYRYLAESIRQFPSVDHLRLKMETAGFKKVSYKKLAGGITAIHSGYKI